jgi:hypothetical protein
MIKKMLKGVVAQREENRQAELYRDFIRREAKIGGKLFGKVSDNIHREFFCLDERTWVWHEEWTDASGEDHVRTTRYDIRPDGVLKAQDGQTYKKISDEEFKNLYRAAKIYSKKVKQELYNRA